MGPHHDVDAAGRQPLQNRFLLSPGAKPAEALDLDAKVLEAVSEGFKMLFREDGGGHQYGHLLAVEHRHEGRSQGHLGLPIAHVAADQPVHRLGTGHILSDIFDRFDLVGGFLVRETALELGHIVVHRLKGETRSNLAGRIELEQFPGNPLGRPPDPGLDLFPGLAPHLVQHGRHTLHAHVLLDEPHTIHRQIEAVAPPVDNREIIVLRAIQPQLGQTVVLTDAVFGVHHEVSLVKVTERQGRLFAPGAALAGPGAVGPENVHVGQHHHTGRRPSETFGKLPFQKPYRRSAAGSQIARRRSLEMDVVGLQQAGDALHLVGVAADQMHRQILMHLFPQPFRQSLKSTGVIRGTARAQSAGRQVEVLHVEGEHRRQVFSRQVRQPNRELAQAQASTGGQLRFGLVPGEKQAFGMDAQLLVLQRGFVVLLCAAREVLGGLFEFRRLPLHHQCIGGHIVQQRVELRIDQRHQAFDAREASILFDAADQMARFVLWQLLFVGLQANAGDNGRQARLRQNRLPGRQHDGFLDFIQTPLGVSRKEPQGFDGIAEKFHPQWIFIEGAIDVQDAAPYAEITRFFHDMGMAVAPVDQLFDEPPAVQILPGHQ